MRERDRLGVGGVCEERSARGGWGWLGVARQELGREQRQRAETEREKREREQSRRLTRVLEGKI